MEEKNQKELDKKFIIDSLKKLGVRYGLHEVFADVVKCCAYSFANAVEMKEDRENEYLRIINKYNNEERDLFPKILAALVNEYEKADEPIDVLGNIYEDLELTKKGSAQFFTPIHLCDFMSKMTLKEEDNKKAIEEKGYINILDPACGSGRFLYTSYGELQKQGIEPNKILLEGDDIDLTCCCMTYIQLSIMGASAIVHHQNTLTKERYDTFYTVGYAMNKELQDKISNKENDAEEEMEV